MEVSVNNKIFKTREIEEKIDIISISESKAVISFLGEQIEVDILENKHKKITLLINGHIQEIEIKDKGDLKAAELGFDDVELDVNLCLKSPMPGLIKEILVSEGDIIKKGQSIIILEAMKMENIIHATGNSKIEKILVKTNSTVEKQQRLIKLTPQ